MMFLRLFIVGMCFFHFTGIAHAFSPILFDDLASLKGKTIYAGALMFLEEETKTADNKITRTKFILVEGEPVEVVSFKMEENKRTQSVDVNDFMVKSSSNHIARVRPHDFSKTPLDFNLAEPKSLKILSKQLPESMEKSLSNFIKAAKLYQFTAYESRTDLWKNNKKYAWDFEAIQGAYQHVTKAYTRIAGIVTTGPDSEKEKLATYDGNGEAWVLKLPENEQKSLFRRGGTDDNHRKGYGKLQEKIKKMTEVAQEIHFYIEANGKLKQYQADPKQDDWLKKEIEKLKNERERAQETLSKIYPKFIKEIK